MKIYRILKSAMPFTIFCLFSCNAFKYGYTENKAWNTFFLITGNENNFGDKRLLYNEKFHRCSCFKNFLSSNSYPEFIYEYKTEDKCKGIKLFYPLKDSVYVFEEEKKGKRYAAIKESRKMNADEREAYQQLKAAAL